MPVIRACSACGAKNRVPAEHLADTGRCGACKQALPPMNQPIAADAALFEEVVRTAKVPVLVDFWAAWCGPCRMVGPEVERTASMMAGDAVVLKVDTEAQPELAGRYEIRSIPMLMVFAGGNLVQQQAGAVGHQQMIAWLKAARTAYA